MANEWALLGNDILSIEVIAHTVEGLGSSGSMIT